MKRLAFVFSIAIAVTGLSVHAQDSTRKELLGRYIFPAGSVVEEVIVGLDNGKLQMNSSAGVSALEPMKGDTFNIVNFNGIAVFKRNDVRKITGVHIDASGYVLDGAKDTAASKLSQNYSHPRVADSMSPATVFTSLQQPVQNFAVVDRLNGRLTEE